MASAALVEVYARLAHSGMEVPEFVRIFLETHRVVGRLSSYNLNPPSFLILREVLGFGKGLVLLGGSI